MMTIYISGKITGREITEVEKQFSEAEAKLSNFGFTVVNPLKIKHNHDLTWESYMRYDIIEMLKCDAIHPLKGWEDSKGAKIEVQLAKDLNFHIIL